MGIVARTRKSGILAIFVFAVCVPVFAQPSLIEQGRAAMQRNDAEAAARFFEQAVAQNPGSASTISGSHLLFGVGAGADYLVTRVPTDGVGVVFGVRAGMFVAPNPELQNRTPVEALREGESPAPVWFAASPTF